MKKAAPWRLVRSRHRTESVDTQAATR